MRRASAGARVLARLCVLAAAFGCHSAPRRPETKEEFACRFRASFDAGDEAAVLAMVHWDGVSDDLRETVEFMLTAGLGRHKVTGIRTVPAEPPPPGAMVVEGRKVRPNLEPVFLLVAEHERGEASRGALRAAVGMVDGHYRFCGLVWDDDEEEPGGDAEEADGAHRMSPEETPLGTELSTVETISLKRTDGSGERGQSIAGTDGWQAITSAEFRGQPAWSILQALDKEGRWYRGLENLPEGSYDLCVSGLPRPPEEVFDLCRRAYEGTFRVRITAARSEWKAYRITPPKEPVPAITAWSEGPAGCRMTLRGYEITGYTFGDFAEWLEVGYLLD